MIAALPLYMKLHSYGEYVFDWAWADAYERNGLKYYPKLLSEIPFIPVTDGRLLALDDQKRAALMALLQSLRQETQTSSAHILYPPADQASALQ